jgi:hypothetical protein
MQERQLFKMRSKGKARREGNIQKAEARRVKWER